MKKAKYIRNLLVILILIYYAQGTLYESGSIFSQSVLFVIIIISGYYLLKTLHQEKNKNTFYKVWTVFLLLNIVGFILTGSISNNLHFSMFKAIIMTSFSFYPFYYFSQIGILKAKHLRIFFILMLPMTILQYWLRSNQLIEDMYNSSRLVNDRAYIFVALIPFTFLFKQKRIYGFISMVILMYFVIQSGKRGAVISGTIGLLIFGYYQLKIRGGEIRYRNYIVLIIGILGLGYMGYNLFQNNEFLISRMQDIGEVGGSSNRDIIFTNLYTAWLNSNNIMNLLFGFGFAISVNISGTGNYAHNDWLELLSNFGLLGVVLYGSVFYVAVKHIINKKWNLDKRLLLLVIVLMWFMDTLVSMSYTNSNGLIQSIMLAYLFGSNSRSLE